MSLLPDAERIAAVAELVAREGIVCGGISVAGAQGDVAVLRTAAVDADRLAALSRGIKALGFRYVTIDLESIAANP
jgi:chitinase